MDSFTPSKATSKEPSEDGDIDDQLLFTPSPVQEHFPDSFDSTPIPFAVKTGAVSAQLEADLMTNDQEQDEDQVMDGAETDLIANEDIKQEPSEGTQDFLIFEQAVKSIKPTASYQNAIIPSRIKEFPSDIDIGFKAVEVEVIVRQPRKRVRIEVPLELRRWSRRIAGPAREFNRYFKRLPLELQKTIWGYAAANAYRLSRCVYIRNRSLRPTQGTFEDGVMNQMPDLWDSCGAARDVMFINYELMFARMLPKSTPTASNNSANTTTPASRMGPSVSHLSMVPYINNALGTDHEYDYTNQQLVNPDSDVIILEPCCTGCRANHCVKKQFNILDRNSIRHLAVQTESPSLSALTRKCWVTVSSSFSSVEKLYLITNFDTMPRNSKTRRALIRVKEGAREESLQLAFSAWKEIEEFGGGGKDRRIQEIIFVVMVEFRRPCPGQKPGEQYDFIRNRLGGPGDIVVG